MKERLLESLRRSHLRIARPTDRLEEQLRFYCDVLGYEELGRFENHEGFDGVMVGHRDAAYHLEFTHCRGENVGNAPSQEHLLVHYVASESEWREIVHSIREAGGQSVPAFNPYWDRHGVTFEDPDGYRVVIFCGSWPPGISQTDNATS